MEVQRSRPQKVGEIELERLLPSAAMKGSRDQVRVISEVYVLRLIREVRFGPSKAAVSSAMVILDGNRPRPRQSASHGFHYYEFQRAELFPCSLTNSVQGALSSDR